MSQSFFCNSIEVMLYNIVVCFIKVELYYTNDSIYIPIYSKNLIQINETNYNRLTVYIN